MMQAPLLEAEERVLSTLNKDGSRRWLTPKLSMGRYWKRRRAVGYGLIALFVTLPWLTVNDKPAVLLNIAQREFTLFGQTFLPTDSVLLMLLMVGIFLTVFLVTALAGRIWCGWACPQTVYMEFVFRPIERWANGSPGRKHMLPKGLRKGLQYGLYLAISFFLAHTFLSYFVGVEQLRHWITRPPGEHVAGFLVVLFVTGAMFFDFAVFREQTCIVACPYGRFQSVMLDRNSLVVGYDKVRGEPRGKIKRKPEGVSEDLSLKVLPSADASAGSGRTADCVDCAMCVQVCPTGIDIRNGLQLECIHCAQCIDACDAVMDKLKRPRGLVRYSSQNAIESGKGRLLRPRVFIYPVLLILIAGIFVWRLASMQDAYVSVLRGKGMAFTTMPDGSIANTVQVRVVNRSPEERTYRIEIIEPAAATLVADTMEITAARGELVERGFIVSVPPSTTAGGSAKAIFRVSDGHGTVIEKSFTLLGPSGGARSGTGANP